MIENNEELEVLDLSTESPAQTVITVADGNASTSSTESAAQPAALPEPTADDDPVTIRVKNAIFHFLTTYCNFTPMDASILLQNFVRDNVWAAMAALKLNLSFEETDDFWEQTTAELVMATVIVLALVPLNSLLLSKIFNIPFKETIINTTIASVACLAAIAPWNVFQRIGESFFLSRGYSNTQASYLSGVFIGPGVIETLTQSVINNTGSFFFNNMYRGTVGGYIAAILPYQVIPGNLWQIIFATTSRIKKKSIRAVTSAFGVGSLLFIANGIDIKLTAFCAGQINNCCANLHRKLNYVRTLVNTGSPVVGAGPQQATQDTPAPEGNVSRPM